MNLKKVANVACGTGISLVGLTVASAPCRRPKLCAWDQPSSRLSGPRQGRSVPAGHDWASGGECQAVSLRLRGRGPEGHAAVAVNGRGRGFRRQGLPPGRWDRTPWPASRALPWSGTRGLTSARRVLCFTRARRLLRRRSLDPKAL